MEARKENDISLPEWIQTDTHYLPKDITSGSVDEFKKEMTEIFDGVKQAIDHIFKLDPGDSDEDEGEDE